MHGWTQYVERFPHSRRVMVRTRRESELCTASAATCISSITRFVWAGDQLLWELKAPGTERDDLEATTGSGERFGRVSYTHGGGIDRPLVLHKEGWQSILPHESWRGQFAGGTCVPDATVPCGTPQWPGWQTNAYHYGTTPPQNEAWHGSLVDDMRDATGQMYKRNRYYDPRTGQFTQPDPIGIAGGLNVYGFAAGDPVSYSDPYGLNPCLLYPKACDIVAGAAIGAVMGAATQALSNVATNRPVSEGMGRAALTGGVAGGALGGVATVARSLRGAGLADDVARAGATAATRINTLDDVVRNPGLLEGRAPGQIVDAIESSPHWQRGTMLRSASRPDEGLTLREINRNGNPTGRYIQWHPGGGHHGPHPYWKVSSGELGVIRVPAYRGN
jgi:RHS repeat-associated protein